MARLAVRLELMTTQLLLLLTFIHDLSALWVDSE